MKSNQTYPGSRLLLIFFLSYFSLPIFANSEQKEFIVGVENVKYFPLYNAEDNGNYSGYVHDLLEAFAHKSNIKFKYEPRPVARLYHEYLVEDKFDFKFPDNPKWQTDIKERYKNGISSNFYYSEKVLKYTDGVFVTKGNKDKDIQFLKKLATLRGFTPSKYMNNGNIKIVVKSAIEDVLDDVKNNRNGIDGAYFNVDVVKYALKNTGYSDTIVFNKNLPFEQDYYYLSSKKHPDIIKKFNDFLKSNKASIDKLKKKYSLQNQY